MAACLLSLAFSPPPKTRTKETQQQMANRKGIIVPATKMTVANLIAAKSCCRDIFCVKNDSVYISAHSRHSSETEPPFHNISCTPMVMFGFWVGPDVEDGWGPVEAYVNRTF